MQGEKIQVVVYGSEMPCQSCVHQPSSRETYDWLQAAIHRKYERQVEFLYIDIASPPKEHQDFAAKVADGEFFYPVVLINDKVVAEGNPQLKRIYAELERKGLQSVQAN